jgi:hypothetical protein
MSMRMRIQCRSRTGNEVVTSWRDGVDGRLGSLVRGENIAELHLLEDLGDVIHPKLVVALLSLNVPLGLASVQPECEFGLHHARYLRVCVVEWPQKKNPA